MNHVQSVDHRDSEFFHRDVLDLLDLLCRDGSRTAGRSERVQERAYLIFFYEVSYFRSVDQIVRAECPGSELYHLTDFFFNGHLLQDAFDFAFDGFVLRNGAGSGCLSGSAGCEYDAH